MNLNWVGFVNTGHGMAMILRRSGKGTMILNSGDWKTFTVLFKDW